MRGFERITFDPNVMGGRACVRGMRVTVSLVLNLVASGMSTEEITEAYSYLEPEDVGQALRYAAWLAEETPLPLRQATIRKDDKVTGALNHLYSEEPSGLDEDMAQMQLLSLPREDW